MRADDDLRWGILQTDICEQEQCQKSSMATVNVHPPLGHPHRSCRQYASPHPPDLGDWGSARECFLPHPLAESNGPGPSASYTSRSASDVPAAANAGPSGHGKRTTGAIHVLGSRGSTPRARSSPSMRSTHARTMSGATALRTTRNPCVEKSPVGTAIPFSYGGFFLCHVCDRRDRVNGCLQAGPRFPLTGEVVSPTGASRRYRRHCRWCGPCSRGSRYRSSLLTYLKPGGAGRCPISSLSPISPG